MFGYKRSTELKSEFEENLLLSIDSMYNLAYRMTRHRENAGDLVQEASLKAYQAYHQFQKGTNFKAWVLTILRNQFINQYRQKSKEPKKVAYEEFEEIIETPQMNGFEEEIFGEHVQRSLDDLPEDLRVVVVLFYVEDLSYKEIAQVMQCPIGTVMSRLHMARQMLKKRLQQVIKEGGIEN